MKQFVLALCLVLAGLGGAGVTSHGVAVAASGGNSDAGHACQQGGYLNLHRSDGTTFKNEGQCVSYAARGGYIPGVGPCKVTGTSGCVIFNNAILPGMFGGTLTLNGATSFVDACTTGTGQCVFGGPNTLATGGGTYVVKDATGAISSQGIYRINNTAGTLEELSVLVYFDLTGNPVSSCAAAAGERLVVLGATLIDTSGATQEAYITAVTGGLSPTFPAAQVGVLGGGFFQAGGLSSSVMTISC